MKTPTNSDIPGFASQNADLSFISGVAPAHYAAPAGLENYSFFQALRVIERQRLAQPRIGYALRPDNEVVRIGQPAELTFAPSTLAPSSHSTQSPPVTVARPERPSPVVIEQRFLGLLGPSGPMPLHITETVRDRKRHAGDESLQAFLDIFHHRAATLFYRAWSDAQPSVQRDRPDDDRFARFLGSLVGVGSPSSRQRDACPDDNKRYHAGHLAGHHRHAEGLEQIVAGLLNVPTRVCSFALRKLELAKSERTSLSSQRPGIRSSRQSNCLGHTALLGQSVADCTSMIELRIGPMDYTAFQQLLPGSATRDQLAATVRHYAGPAIDTAVTVCLKHDQLPNVTLGRSGQLGRNSWIGSRPGSQDRADYRFEIAGAGRTRSTNPKGSQA